MPPLLRLLQYPFPQSQLSPRYTGGESDFEIAIPVSHAASTGGSLDEKREQVRIEAINSFNFKETSLPKWNGTEVNCYNASTKTFTVTTPEHFAYALHYAGNYAGSTINIMSDLDMGGGIGRNFVNNSRWTQVRLNGNNHTIYNVYSKTSAAGICNYAVSSSVNNLHVTSSRVECTGATNSGIFGRFIDSSFNGVTVSNSMTIHLTGELSYVSASVVASLIGNGTIDNCHSINNVIIGESHVGAVVGEYSGSISNSSSQDDLIISNGGHGGAFAGCSGSSRINQFSNCFTNSTIYGNTDVGGFSCGIDAYGAVYQNCFAACVVEGNTNIGGFIGQTNPYRSKNTGRTNTFINCYSTSMVGMNYNGENLGGFVGQSNTGKYINCFAAGEVGSIDTDIDSTTNIGGFVGDIQSLSYYPPSEFTSCYYDMQTTAMKNKAVGAAPLIAMTRDATGVETASYLGIKGLTTNKMTSPSSNLFPSGYTYAAGLYPQLSSMFAHSNILFRAQSAASTATVFCDDWDDITQTGFDTVRDTMRNYSFSSLESFGSNENFSSAHVSDSPNITSISWSTDGNVSPLDHASPVIELAASPYYSTAVHPGVEWTSVNLTYADPSTHQSATGSRRVRLIPTSIIEVGGDKRIDVFYDGDNNETQAYDHKEGFATTYLDAKTLQSYIDSSTAHPEAVLSFADIVNQQYADGVITGTMNLPFNSTVTNLAVIASMTDSKTGAPAYIEDLYNKLNGTSLFEAQDCGLYNIAYKASLTDGRYLSVGKKLAVVGPWSVVYNYNYTGLLAGENIRPDSIFHVVSNLMSFDGFTFADYDAPPIRDGWELSYWSLDMEGKQPVDQAWFDAYEKNYGTLNRNTDVYAQWKKLSPPAMVDVVLDPRIGSYGNNQTGEKIVLFGAPGDKVVIEVATAPEDWRFADWTADDLGGGTLERSDTGKWVYTFGEADGALHAEYKRTHYTVTWRDGLDGSIVKVEKVAVGGKVEDVSEDEIPHHPGHMYVGYDVEELPESVENDIEITLMYELILIDMPETGSSEMLMVTVMGMFLIVMACIGFSYRKRRGSNVFRRDV